MCIETVGGIRERIQSYILAEDLKLSFCVLLENVEHCGGEPEQAATMATHE